MDIFEAIYSRRSIRRYRPEPVPDEALTRLLEAACWAPSAHNRQPWRFAVITTGETKARLAQAMGARLRADLERDGAPQEVIEKDTARSYGRITGAPVVILACLTLAEMDAYPDARRSQAEWVMAAQSVAMAVQNLLLAAHAEGLGACWMCAPLFCPDAVRAALDLPEDWQPQALITLGAPAEQPKEKGRAPLSSRVLYYLSSPPEPDFRTGLKPGTGGRGAGDEGQLPSPEVGRGAGGEGRLPSPNFGRGAGGEGA